MLCAFVIVFAAAVTPPPSPARALVTPPCSPLPPSAFDDAIRIANGETTKAERAKLLMDATDLRAIEDYIKARKLQLMVRADVAGTHQHRPLRPRALALPRLPRRLACPAPCCRVRPPRCPRQLYRMESLLAVGGDVVTVEAGPSPATGVASFADVCALYTRALGTVRELKALYGGEDKPAAVAPVAAKAAATSAAAAAAADAAALSLERDEVAIAALAAKERRFVAFRCFQAALALAAASKVGA